MPTFHHHHAVRPALFYLVAESSASEGRLLPLKLQFPVKKCGCAHRADKEAGSSATAPAAVRHP